MENCDRILTSMELIIAYPVRDNGGCGKLKKLLKLLDNEIMLM